MAEEGVWSSVNGKEKIGLRGDVNMFIHLIRVNVNIGWSPVLQTDRLPDGIVSPNVHDQARMFKTATRVKDSFHIESIYINQKR